MKNAFSLKAEFSAPPETIFKAWLSSEEHGEMTGSPAQIEPRVGGVFTAWDGYITGKTLELKPHSRIVQAWRTGEFGDADPDSRLEIELEAVTNGTRLKLTHSNIPEGQAESYKTGWAEWYFGPMREYFNK
jgi:activator of HSP90 ATPase